MTILMLIPHPPALALIGSSRSTYALNLVDSLQRMSVLVAPRRFGPLLFLPQIERKQNKKNEPHPNFPGPRGGKGARSGGERTLPRWTEANQKKRERERNSKKRQGRNSTPDLPRYFPPKLIQKCGGEEMHASPWSALQVICNESLTRFYNCW